MDLQILNSARLRLEPLMVSHTETMFEAFQDPQLYTWIRLGPPPDLEEFRKGIEFLEKRLSKDRSEYWLNWMCFDSASGELIGKVEASMDRKTRHTYLAYFVFRPHWKKGYAKEACATVIEHLFDRWQVSKIIIEMDTRNTASFRLAESLGAKRVGFKSQAKFFKGSWSDEYVYEILRRTP